MKKGQKKSKAAVNIIAVLAIAIITFLKVPLGELNDNNANGGFDESTVIGESDLVVRFIDVGQADSTLISYGDNDILIDAGNNDDFPLIEEELKKIDDLEYIILTHPHEDHIGGADKVIESKWVNSDTKIIMPKKTHTTKTFKDVVKAIKNKSLTITEAVVGDTYSLGEAEFIILSPKNGKNYGKNLNNWSVGMRLKYGNTSFLVCGDAEKESETDMLENGIALNSDVYQVNHHGSRTSNTDAFLDAVNPKFAVFSCGKDNDYGHPHAEIIEAMKDRNIKCYRTDENGTVVMISDGENIRVQ